MDAACGLFNDRGTATVTTNQIAAEAGLSPGNLYYHYADKQAIIRALFARYAAAHEGRWHGNAAAVPDLDALREGIAVSMAVAWDYRFFAREMLALLRADPELAATYHEIYERHLDEWHALGERLVADGLVRPPSSPHTLRNLNEALWLVAEGWLPFLDANRRAGGREADRPGSRPRVRGAGVAPHHQGAPRHEERHRAPGEKKGAHTSSTDQTPARGIDRRRFLGAVGLGAATCAVAGVSGLTVRAIGQEVLTPSRGAGTRVATLARQPRRWTRRSRSVGGTRRERAQHATLALRRRS